MSTTSERPQAPASFPAWVEEAYALEARARRRLPAPQVALDAAALAFASLVAHLGTARADGAYPVQWLAAFSLLALLSLNAGRRPSRALRPHVLDEVRRVVARTAFVAMVVLSLRAMLEAGSHPAGQTARLWLAAAALLSATRIVPALWQLRARERGEAGIPTLIVGAGRVGTLVARRLRQYPELGLRPIGFLDDSPLEDEPDDLPVLGGLANFDAIVDRYRPERVIVAFSPASHEELLEIVRRCEERRIDASFVPRLFETMKERVGIEFVGSLPLVAIEPTNPKSWHFTFKYTVDRVLAGILLLLAAPVLVACAVAVLASVGRPVLFRQRRMGRDGRVFDMLKFRTMRGAYNDQDVRLLPPDTAPGGVEGDDRRTTVGRILRRTSLDELPQLINVLRGEMSLVGPRPERPEFVEVFQRSVHRYSERHRVKAGITGWAQVHGLRGKTSLADRIEWDNYYIDNWSPWLDFKILALTFLAIVRFRAE